MRGGALRAGLKAGTDLGVSEGGVGSLCAGRLALSSLQSCSRMSARPGTPAVMPPAAQVNLSKPPLMAPLPQAVCHMRHSAHCVQRTEALSACVLLYGGLGPHVYNARIEQP